MAIIHNANKAQRITSIISSTIRLIIGRGWGQGPTHSQSLQSWFAHIPGLKVVMPSLPSTAYNLLKNSIRDPNPVIFIEHRWLHSMKGYVPSTKYNISLGKSKKILVGNHITIVSMSYMTVEAINSAKLLKHHGINCEVIDLRTVSPIDYKLSVRK